MNKATEAPNSGRVCPMDYRYTPGDLAVTPVTATDTLYVVGGLYGNPFALTEAQKLLDTENAQCIFNGDFNWFNCSDDDFVSLNNTVLKHDCIRGNVETELARRPFDGGCGCGYPDSVADDVVDWSNNIIARLNATARNHETLQSDLQALPMSKRYQVGDSAVQVIHGDCRSLAGWSLSREALSNPATETLKDIAACNADIIACTHTCEPIATTLSSAATGAQKDIAIINNGAAGMPNFNHDLFGLVTRISTTPAPTAAVYGTELDGVYIDAIALRFDQEAFLQWFVEHWPPGTPAHQSYFTRLSSGANTNLAEARGTGFS